MAADVEIVSTQPNDNQGQNDIIVLENRLSIPETNNILIKLDQAGKEVEQILKNHFE